MMSRSETTENLQFRKQAFALASSSTDYKVTNANKKKWALTKNAV